MKKSNNNSQTILLYQAIMQSNLHPTTKSFLGEVLKNQAFGYAPLTGEALSEGKQKVDMVAPDNEMLTEPDPLTNLDWAPSEEDAVLMEQMERSQRNLGGLKPGKQDWSVDQGRIKELLENA